VVSDSGGLSSLDRRPYGNFESEMHCLFCGMVMGLAWRHGLGVLPMVDDAGMYLPRWTLDVPGMPDGVKLEVVVPAPPDGWDAQAWMASLDLT
jgi:hypothetical protein